MSQVTCHARYVQVFKSPLSLDRPIDNADGPSFESILEDKDAPNPEEAAYKV